VALTPVVAVVTLAAVAALVVVMAVPPRKFDPAMLLLPPMHKEK
jgi:hypothetical protein